MTRYTVATITLAAIVSGAAAYVGHFAAETADRYMRDAAYVPLRGVQGPKEPPPGTFVETVSDLEENPFWGRTDNGALIPKDPERRAKQKASLQYAEVSRFAYAFAKVIPTFAVIVLCFLAMHNAVQKRRREEVRQVIDDERSTDSTAHGVSLEARPHSKEVS